MEKEMFLKITKLCRLGLLTDGEHHKQWYLERVLLEIGFDEEYLEMLRTDHLIVKGVPG